MVVCLSCKNEEDPIKNEGARGLTRLNFNFSDCSRAAYSAVSGGIWSKFELIQTFMVVLLTGKNKEDPVKNEATRVLTTFHPL